jgi:hypothetical protein
MTKMPQTSLADSVPELPTHTGQVSLIPRYDDAISYPNCLVVDPFRKLAYGKVIMATVEHYFENQNTSGFPWTIIPVLEKPLPLKNAVTAAVSFAEKNNIPVILLNQDGFSSASEKRQTDTQALKTSASPGG